MKLFVRKERVLACSINSERGATLLGVIVLASVIGIVVFLFIAQTTQLRKKETLLQEELTAEVQASELLETLRAFEGGDKLISYMGTKGYLVCAPINILNRTLNQKQNPDTIADFGWSALKKSNRYYQVRVFDVMTNSVDSTWCGTPFTNRAGKVLVRLSDGKRLDADSRWRILITVGVSWEASEHAGGTVHEVAMSTLLPVQSTP